MRLEGPKLNLQNFKNFYKGKYFAPFQNYLRDGGARNPWFTPPPPNIRFVPQAQVEGQVENLEVGGSKPKPSKLEKLLQRKIFCSLAAKIQDNYIVWNNLRGRVGGVETLGLHPPPLPTLRIVPQSLVSSR